MSVSHLNTIVTAIGMVVESGNVNKLQSTAAIEIFNLHRRQPRQLGFSSSQLRSFDFDQADHRTIFKKMLRESFEADMNDGLHRSLGNELAEDIYLQMLNLLFLKDGDAVSIFPDKSGEYSVTLTGGKKCSLYYLHATRIWEDRTGNSPVPVGSQQMVLLPGEFVPRIVLSWTDAKEIDEGIEKLKGIVRLMESNPDAVRAAVQRSLRESGGIDSDSGERALNAVAKLLK